MEFAIQSKFSTDQITAITRMTNIKGRIVGQLKIFKTNYVGTYGEPLWLSGKVMKMRK
jgi:hypothetical protein